MTIVPYEGPKPASLGDRSISDYETSPRSTNGSFSETMLSPGGYLPTTGSGLERGLALFTSPQQKISSQAPDPRHSPPTAGCSEKELLRSQRTFPSKSERRSLSPSPTRTEAAKNSGGTGSKSLFSRLRKKSSSPRKLADLVLGRERSKSMTGGNMMQEGNGGGI